MNWYLFGFIFYGILMVVIGILASRRIKNSSDYMVAGKSLPFYLLAFTFAGLWFTGGGIMGAGGTVFEMGIWNTEWAWGVIADPFGAGLCIVLLGLFYFTVLRKVGGMTLPDFFTSRFGKKSALLSVLILMFGWVFFIAGEIAVIGKIFQAVLGWDYGISVIIGMVLVIGYTLLGGLWSVAITDTVQMIIILIGLLIALPIGLDLVGGFAGLKAVVPSEMMSFFPTRTANIGMAGRWIPWIAAWMIVGFGSMPSPDINQIAHAGRTDKETKIAAIAAGIIFWVFGTIVVILGLIGFALVSEQILSPEVIAMVHDDAELIIPLMVKELFPLPLAVIFNIAIVAAVMSVADGGILSISTLFTKNVVQDWIKPDMEEKKLLLYGRLFVVVFGIITVLISLAFNNVFLLTMFGFDVLLAGLFIPMTLGIYWKKANTPGFIAGVLVGVFTRVVLAGILEGWGFETLMYPVQWYVYTLSAPLANLVALVVVSLLTAKKFPPKPLLDANGKLIEVFSKRIKTG